MVATTEVDVLGIFFSNAPTEGSGDNKSEVITDDDKDGNAVWMEIMGVSEWMDNPREVEYAVME